MNLLDHLRAKNPELPLYSVLDQKFAPYGRVWKFGGADALAEAMRETPIPAEGNIYVADDSALDAQEACREAERVIFGGMATQSGYCNGRGFRLNALEYHKCSEVNFSTTGCVLLLALPAMLRDCHLDSSRVAGFYLPPDTMVEIFPQVMHFAPCRVTEDGFNCLCILEKGVNEALPKVDTSAPGEEKLLWMRGKWLIAHRESVPASRGAYVGITGENLALKL